MAWRRGEERKCLGLDCERVFESAGRGHRLCPRCDARRGAIGRTAGQQARTPAAEFELETAPAPDVPVPD
jgi:hypothetical protein